MRGKITHIDLQEVRLDQPIQTAVVVRLVGDPVGVKEGGVLAQVTNKVNVEALPLEVPQHLEVDVSELGIGDSIRLSEIAAPAGVTFLDDPEEIVLATVTLPTRAEEPEVAEGEEAPVEGEEPAAEGEAAPSGEEAAGEDPRRADPCACRGAGENEPRRSTCSSSASVTRVASTRGTATTSGTWSWTSSPGGTTARGAASSPGSSPTCGSTSTASAC